MINTRSSIHIIARKCRKIIHFRDKFETTLTPLGGFYEFETRYLVLNCVVFGYSVGARALPQFTFVFLEPVRSSSLLFAAFYVCNFGNATIIEGISVRNKGTSR